MGSRRARAWVAVALVTVFQQGCYRTNTSSIGGHSSRPKDCEVEFVRLDHTDRQQMKFYTMVGMVSVTTRFISQPDWNDRLRHEVHPEICKLGGDTASIAATSSLDGGKVHSTNILALLRKPDVDVFGTPAFFESKTPALRQRAAFDLNCDEAELEIVEVGEASRGVRGCGRQGVYRYTLSKEHASGIWEREPQ